MSPLSFWSDDLEGVFPVGDDVVLVFQTEDKRIQPGFNPWDMK
jgi:hypothetical protein